MFYTHELLSCRQRGKLARCWLAATISEKMFKQKYRAESIKNINIFIICEEILKAVEIRNNGTYGRFSLYLSSQLMYGATKILFYQTKILEDNLFNIHRTLFKLNSRKDDFTVGKAFQIPSEVPSIIDVLPPMETLEDLHLIREEPYTSIIRDLMEDNVNFGAISSFEVQEFLLLGTEEPSLNHVLRVPGDNLEGISREFVQAPSIEGITFEVESIETEIETRAPSVRISKEKSSIVFEDQQPQKTAPATPKKRTLQSSAETPSKKNKISSEEVSEFLQRPPPSGPKDIATLDESKQVPVSGKASPRKVSEENTPDREDREIVESRGQKEGKRRKLFDKENNLSHAVMQKWISNVRAHTTEQKPVAITFPSMTEHLKRPLVKNLGKSWGKTLTRFYQRYLTKPVVTQNEFLGELDFESKQTIHSLDKESVRPYSPSKPEQIGVQTLSIITIPDMSNKSKTTIGDMIIDQPENPGYGEETTETHHISDKCDSDDRKPKSPSNSGYSSCSRVYFNTRNFLASLEVYWCNGRFVKFDNLISSETYCKNDVSRAFQYCLELHTEKVIVFKQAEPFDTIWIEKHFNYSSENDSLVS